MSLFAAFAIVCCFSAVVPGIIPRQLSPAEADEHLGERGGGGGHLFPFPVRPEQYDVSVAEGGKDPRTNAALQEKKDYGKALEEEEDEEDEEEDEPGVAPSYMLELYRRFSNDKYSHPMADIVRSFKNINTGVTSIWTSSNFTRTALHSLHFNISSINSEHEDIQLAELRLRTSKKMLTVSVYEVIAPSPGSHPLSRLLLTWRDVSPERSTWQVFSVTEALRRRTKEQQQTTSAGHVFQVRVDTVHRSNDEPEAEEDATGSDVSVDDETILVVFSNQKRESREIRTHENEAREREEEEEGRKRRRRRKRRNGHRFYPPSPPPRPSSPEEEEEESTSGRNSTRPASKPCLSRLSSSSEGRTNRRTKRRTKRRTPVEGLKNRSSSSSSRSGRGKRKDICRRKPMYVDFQDIKWENRILEPPGYQAYECTGRCYFPIGQRLTPTRYAAVKSLLHATYPKRASAPCCVPTRLEPIALLYADEHGTVTYQYQYHDMVVAECGCR